MKLSTNLNEIFNKQITHERKNNAIYLQISSYFKDMQLDNLAEYFDKQAMDEYGHSKMIIDHLNDRTGGKVVLELVDAPHLEINTIADLADIYIATEELTTQQIEYIYTMALLETSYMDLPVILDLLKEQVAEEDEANSFALKIKMCNDLVLFDATLEV